MVHGGNGGVLSDPTKHLKGCDANNQVVPESECRGGFVNTVNREGRVFILWATPARTNQEQRNRQFAGIPRVGLLSLG